MIKGLTPLAINDQCEATSTDTFTRKTNLRNDGSYVRIKCVSVSNADTDAKVAHVGYMKGDIAYYFDTLELTTASKFYACYPDILIPSSYRIVVKIVSPTVGDKYYINIIGEEYFNVKEN